MESAMKAGIVYGSTSGHTKRVAERIRDALGHDAVELFTSIADIEVSALTGYDLLIIGVPSYELGSPQDDWAGKYNELDHVDLTGTKVAFFGLGDRIGYPDTYQSAMGRLYRKFIQRGAKGQYGFRPAAEYQFSKSEAVMDNHFCGLPIDQDNEGNLTGDRIELWCAQIRQETGLVS